MFKHIKTQLEDFSGTTGKYDKPEGVSLILLPPWLESYKEPIVVLEAAVNTSKGILKIHLLWNMSHSCLHDVNFIIQ